MAEGILSEKELAALWPASQTGLWEAFADLTAHASGFAETAVEIYARPGVSYSFRASVPKRTGFRSRPVFFLVDVVVSEADPWFLSVCFYEDEVSDPEELGNPIPAGLFGETGYCFDVDDRDELFSAYLKERIGEAHRAASG